MVGHVDLHATLLIGQSHHRTHVVLGHVQMHRHNGLPNLLHLALIGHLGWIFNHDHFAVAFDHFIDHTGCRGDQVLVKLTFESLLHDLHVQQA